MKKPILSSLCVLTLFLAPGAVQGVVIDGMGQAGSWSGQSDSNVTASTSTDAGATRIDYDFTDGAWTLIKKDFSTVDMSAGDELRFNYKGSGSKNQLQVQIMDNDGSVFKKTIDNVTNRSSWTEVGFTYSPSSTAVADFTYSYGGDNVLNTQRIKKISFGVVKIAGGQGTLDIDNVRIYHTNTANVMFNNFDDLTARNRFGGNGGAYGSGCTETYISTDTPGGGALQLVYDVSIPNSYCGYWMDLSSAAVGNTTHLSFLVKGTSGGERFKVELGNNTIFVYVKNYVTINTSWQEVLIPLSDFVGFTPGIANGTLVFTFENNVLGAPNGPPASTVYIDEIRFVRPGASSALMATLDTMNEPPSAIGAWKPYGETDTNASLHSVPGVTGIDTDRALELKYAFTSGIWAVMERVLNLNVTDGTNFSFTYKGTGAGSNLQFKVTDSTGTTYHKILYGITNTGDQWRTATIPYTELSYLSGRQMSQHQLDLKALDMISLTVSRNNGSTGSVWIKDLQYSTPPSATFSSGRVLSAFSVPYNPIAPNSNSVNAKAQFVYTLSDSAVVKLEIFSLKGSCLFSSEKSVTADGNQHVIEWDGKDNDQKLVANGLYIFRVTAEGYSGQKDKITNIIGVIR